MERRGGPAQETRSRKRACGGCSLASRPGSGKSRTYTDLLFSTDRYLFQEGIPHTHQPSAGLIKSREGISRSVAIGIGGVEDWELAVGSGSCGEGLPVPDAELERVGAAVGAGAEGVDAPLGEAGDGLHAGVWPAQAAAAAHGRVRRRRARGRWPVTD